MIRKLDTHLRRYRWWKCQHIFVLHSASTCTQVILIQKQMIITSQNQKVFDKWNTTIERIIYSNIQFTSNLFRYLNKFFKVNIFFTHNVVVDASDKLINFFVVSALLFDELWCFYVFAGGFLNGIATGFVFCFERDVDEHDTHFIGIDGLIVIDVIASEGYLHALIDGSHQ